MSEFDQLEAQYKALQLGGRTQEEITQFKMGTLKYLSQINGKLATYINIFNTLVADMTNLITKDFPHKLDIKTYGTVILNLINEDPTQPISLFITQIYANDEYRNNILAQNDQYFEGESFNKITKNENERIQILDQIKSCWHELTVDRKNYIKTAMKTMVDVTRYYVNLKDEGNDIKEMIEWCS